MHSTCLAQGSRVSGSIYRPRQVRTCLRAYADSESPDQPAHPRSLIMAFAVRKTESLDTTEYINAEQRPD